MLPILIALVVGYLLGSLPSGYLVARAKGVNIFEVGSKNPGATNVRRVLGRGPGNLVFFLDALKGAVATAWPYFHLNWTRADGSLKSINFNFSFGTAEAAVTQAAIAGLFGALLGHSFSCFTKFRGGKGVATATGGFLVLVTFPVLTAAVVWFVTFFTTRYVSLASILAAVTVPIATYFFGNPPLVLGLTVLIGIFVVVRHRTNIQRLLSGTEPRFVKKSSALKS